VAVHRLFWLKVLVVLSIDVYRLSYLNEEDWFDFFQFLFFEAAQVESWLHLIKG
jgi:hypothetical protein